MTSRINSTADSYGHTGCKDAVWNKAAIIKDHDPMKWRCDIYGNVIQFQHHGKSTKYGWDIDHYIPKAKGGSDDITNLHPVQSSKNRSMGMKMGDKDKRLWFAALEARACGANAKHRSNNLYDPPAATNKPIKFKYVIGEQVLARQTPVAQTQLAIIKAVDQKQKKVQVYWVCGGYHEKIEMYDKLFMKMSCRSRL